MKALYNLLIKDNPVFVLLLGLCPTLAVTTSAINGISMGLATAFVLIASNIMVSLVRKIVPDQVRIPVFITIIASFVTIVDLMMGAFLPELHKSLGIFIPLIVVNCIILGRAEAFASKHNIFSSTWDAIQKGLAFTFALFVLGAIREFLGNRTFFGVQEIHIYFFYPEFYTNGMFISFVKMELTWLSSFFNFIFQIILKIYQKEMLIMILPPGAFIVLGFLIAFFGNLGKEKHSQTT